MRHLVGAGILAGLTLGTAGVAHANYSVSNTTYAWSTAPTLLSGASSCDDCAAVVNLPFAFPYWGLTYTQASVSSNGTVTFGNNTAAPFSNVALGPLGSAALPGATIAVLWDDWNTSAGGDIYTGTVNGAFVIEWRNVYHYGQSAGAGTSFQVKLFADGRIETHYGNLVTNNTAWDRGVSATVGLQEFTTTIAQNVSANATLSSNSARLFQRPGAAAFYANVKDAFYNPGRRRANLKWGQSVQCANNAWSWVEVVTNATSDWSWGVANCAGASLWPNTTFYGDVQGYDVATVPLSPVTDVVRGTYHFIIRSDFTPAPVAGPRYPVAYGTSPTYTSKLDYWAGNDGVLDKTTLVVTGFDPLNESSTADYLVLLGDLARTAFAEGRDIAIGKFGDGNQRISSFNGEVANWVSDAYARQGNKKLQLAGVSMGGVITRSTVAANVAGVQSKITAWYSVDSPQTGANLGRANRGLQDLILCNKDASDPQYRTIFSNPAADMMNVRVANCSCDNEPENSTCTGTTQYHDQYYNAVSWPTAVPRYAVAFGDANATGGYSKMGSGTLYDFHYTGWFCSEDRDWNGGQKDCNAGSLYLDAATVNTDESASVCGTFQLRLKYNPAFINVDSALGVATSLQSDAEDASCSSNYPTLAPTYWTGWASNTYNEKHTVLSASLRDQLLTWMRANDPVSGGGGTTSTQTPVL
jgi:hypothetical protein